MKPLDSAYKEEIERIKSAIQNSDQLAAYLETEEESDYKELSDHFEPQLQELYDQIATDNPLQLLAFEKEILDDRLEGLFLPRILGFAVLRGAVGEDYKYIRPQDSFRDILNFICESVYFEFIRNRIGQTVQIGFALNSNIWNSSFISKMSNKRVAQYLTNLQSEDLWHEEDRKNAYKKYKQQFEGYNFYSIEFPADPIELRASYRQFVDFMKYRIHHQLDSSSFSGELVDFLENENLHDAQEFVNILGLSAHFIEFEEKERLRVAALYKKLRQEDKDFQKKHFYFLERLMKSDIQVTTESFDRLYNLLSDTIEDDIYEFYEVQHVIREHGLGSEVTIDAVRQAYNNHEGLSDFNEVLRRVIYIYFAEELEAIDPERYTDYFELNKLMTIYIRMFDNQFFNQEIKHASVRLIKKFLKVYTYKRGKDYQDIKKFVVSQFQELGFMDEKEVLEIFKTRKRRRKTT